MLVPQDTLPQPLLQLQLQTATFVLRVSTAWDRMEIVWLALPVATRLGLSMVLRLLYALFVQPDIRLPRLLPLHHRTVPCALLASMALDLMMTAPLAQKEDIKLVLVMEVTRTLFVLHVPLGTQLLIQDPFFNLLVQYALLAIFLIMALVMEQAQRQVVQSVTPTLLIAALLVLVHAMLAILGLATLDLAQMVLMVARPALKELSIVGASDVIRVLPVLISLI